MKFMGLADIHQSEEKWEQLVGAVREVKPEIVAIAGDLLPKYNGTLAQLSYMPHLKESALAIKDSGAELVLILGNDDNQLLIPEMEKGDKEGLWHYVADRVKIIRGHEFCGCPWIRDYPFAYKYWVAPDSFDNLYINHFQLGPPLLINDRNEITTIPDLKTYLGNKMPIIKSLENMAARVKDISQSIWLIHEPPTDMGFDHCATGEKVGSPVVNKFLSEKQPLLSIHGHIHEAPKYNGGVWAGKIGGTFCIQAGQLDDHLYYVTFDLDNGEIANLTHSLYGRFII